MVKVQDLSSQLENNEKAMKKEFLFIQSQAKDLATAFIEV